MKSMKQHILFFFAVIIFYSIITMALSSLKGDINYELNITQTLIVGVFTTVLVGWINRRAAEKELEGDEGV